MADPRVSCGFSEKAETMCLIVVDAEKSFFNGDLKVGDSDDARDHVIEKIVSLLTSFAWGLAVFTRDAHPEEHVSFKRGTDGDKKERVCITPESVYLQALWPPHCEQDTQGMQLVSKLSAYAPDHKTPSGVRVAPVRGSAAACVFFDKGTDRTRDAYSAFRSADGVTEPVTPDVTDKKDTIKGMTFAEMLRSRGIQTVVVCGVALDVCVKATCADAARAGFAVILLQDACLATGAAVQLPKNPDEFWKRQQDGARGGQGFWKQNLYDVGGGAAVRVVKCATGGCQATGVCQEFAEYTKTIHAPYMLRNPKGTLAGAPPQVRQLLGCVSYVICGKALPFLRKGATLAALELQGKAVHNNKTMLSSAGVAALTGGRQFLIGKFQRDDVKVHQGKHLAVYGDVQQTPLNLSFSDPLDGDLAKRNERAKVLPGTESGDLRAARYMAADTSAAEGTQTIAGLADLYRVFSTSLGFNLILRTKRPNKQADYLQLRYGRYRANIVGPAEERSENDWSSEIMMAQQVLEFRELRAIELLDLCISSLETAIADFTDAKNSPQGYDKTQFAQVLLLFKWIWSEARRMYKKEKGKGKTQGDVLRELGWGYRTVFQTFLNSLTQYQAVPSIAPAFSVCSPHFQNLFHPTTPEPSFTNFPESPDDISKLWAGDKAPRETAAYEHVTALARRTALTSKTCYDAYLNQIGFCTSNMSGYGNGSPRSAAEMADLESFLVLLKEQTQNRTDRLA